MSDQDNSMDQSFNDAELQDIMNEIENLEKEFVEEDDEGTEAMADASDDAQSNVDEPTAEEDSVEEESVEEPVSESEEQEVEEEVATAPGFIDADDAVQAEAEHDDEVEPSNVVSISSATTTAKSTGEEGHMSFSGSGQMNMELTFDLGQEKATVTVADGKLQVTMNGVDLYLSEEGCEVNMAGGVKFQVPVGAKGAGKKAA